MTDKGARALAAAIIEQAIYDYVEYKTSDLRKPDQGYVRGEVTRFFRSEWFKDLVYIGFGEDVDPNYIVDATKRKARAHDAQKAKKARAKND